MANLECRMYESRFPEVDMAVMIQVKSIGEMCAYVSLLEYNNIEGMILLSELSRRRIRSINSLIKVGRTEPVMVLHVDEDKGYVNLSKRRVSEEDIQICEDRYNKSKLVHSIMRHVAETMELDLEVLLASNPKVRKTTSAVVLDRYQLFSSTLMVIDIVISASAHNSFFMVEYILSTGSLFSPQGIGKRKLCFSALRKYGHAFEAFKLVVSDPDAILDSLTREVKETGADGKESAMRKAEAAGNEDCPVKIKLVAPPAYVLITQTLDKVQGISVLTKAIAACSEEIERHKGKLTVKEAPRAVSEREDLLLLERMKTLTDANAEKEGDDDSEEEEDTALVSNVVVIPSSSVALRSEHISDPVYVPELTFVPRRIAYELHADHTNAGGRIPMGLKSKSLRVLVTGGSGFVGSHLVDRLMARGDNVIVVDNFFTGRKENVLHHLRNPRFELIRHDVVEPILLEVDQIYHLACPASPVHYKYNPVKTIISFFN
ncbi:Nucleic acid-binding, OB-fold [Artemisia annua]|uniref:Nucleic acid-binding, OB-fold n=1 Tax=Artemisia annua TaxID=35608 RepID=A0A2U1Q0P2_ARTAN|nr:Nucleic acid-binding, OB-fold [Artemisia annua]